MRIIEESIIYATTKLFVNIFYILFKLELFVRKKYISRTSAILILFNLSMSFGYAMDTPSLENFNFQLSSMFNFRGPTLEFHEYPAEYFIFADIPANIITSIIDTKEPRILEIGSGKGYFIDWLLSSALDKCKKIGIMAVEFNEENRKKIQDIYNEYKKTKIKHSCGLSRDLNIADYIRRNPEHKKEFFTSIVSLYSLHCLCPSDLIEVLLAAHQFLKPEGTLWLTLQHPAAIGSGCQKIISEQFSKGDKFPGFNIDEERAKRRIRLFLNQDAAYPINAPQNNKKLYEEPYLFAHDFAPLLPTMHDEQWTKDLLIDFGFDVEICNIRTDHYPPRPLGPGEICTECIETEYLYVRARKKNNIPNLEKIKTYRESATEKEKNIFMLYKSVVDQDK